jgi:hypothetical protein
MRPNRPVTTSGGMMLELNMLRVKQVPAAGFKHLVDQDAGESFILAGGNDFSYPLF